MNSLPPWLLQLLDRRGLLACVIVVLLALGVSIAYAWESRPSDAPEVRLVQQALGYRFSYPTCSSDGKGFTTFTADITNTSNVILSYIIETEYVDSAGTRVDTDTVTIDDLYPGETAEMKTRLDSSHAAPPSRCKIMDVEVR